ncbi:MAG TPA: acyl-CoA desaturase [Marinilabiliales bacterium]|jgi:linoleoyl-CoA desaturase|nr:MAG: fatty acid desaturase [Bacteroidetes bacterium GWD2_40_43]OFX94112.1 MAG: fatty acid desaturase [Bacteroidetes bacterium GWE2_40_63]OFY18056.1 MAG: fatty acid desaturase [Bacteroidetes bacterium GWF2_40_13]OFZ30262.1 MAG: fatty acid desaturase [Bacteroidetes bacterium RIFOXYC2_FULL_40_12]HAM97880.1 acyl-CoA desaturase [Marinilabiliales bacterium]
METPEFAQPSNTFHIELKNRVNAYFKEKKLKPTGNWSLYSKAILILLAFLSIYIHLVFFTPPLIWLAIVECIALGGLTAAIGFNIMHDGAHGSFSKKEWLNELAGLSINFLGANVYMWKTKHNVIHHTYTNIDGLDDDINARPFLRMCENQKKYSIHKFQHLYFVFVYSLLYLYWVFFTDYNKYFTGMIGSRPIKKMKTGDHFSFWGFKALNLILFMGVPIYMVGFLPWLIGFLVYGLFAGIVLSMVFQLAHTVEDTYFPVTDNGVAHVEDEWVIHQLRVTANFATQNRVVSWFIGGLNFQIEHHLFKKISHVHYPAISKILKQVCQEYNIRYIEYPKVHLAVASHIHHLQNIGRK